MKKILSCILIVHAFAVAFCQSKDDYAVVKSFLGDYSKWEKGDTIHIDKFTVNFQNQERFFTPNFLSDYTGPTIGVNSDSVRKLITKMDYSYLAAEQRISARWEIKRLSNAKVVYIKDPENLLSGKKHLKIALPVYSEDKKIAFLYYKSICGYMDCSYYGVRVFRKVKSKWKFCVEFPLIAS
jgi:hypothetical protein